MSIKTDAELIRDETITGANTAARVGGNLVDIADDLAAKQVEIDANTSQVATNTSKLSGIESNAKDDQTGAEIKALYEAEANTNAFTDALLNKINSITEIFTTALKSAYDSASSWVTTNGTNVVSHLTDLANPHSVTKAQVSLGNVDNTSDANKPVSTAQQTALDLKQDSITLTTTGTSGASTLVSGTLNIPQYSGGGGSPEGTAVLSTGETVGKVLQADGDGTSSWVALGGGGDMLASNNLSDVSNVATARTNLGVDVAGTDNSTDVTLAGTGTYLSLVGQAITVDPITESDISDLGTYQEFDTLTRDTPTKWVGTQAQYDIDFPSGHGTREVWITDAASTLVAADITDFDAEVSNNTSVAANTAKNTYPSGDATKVGHLTVTQAVDLDTIESNVTTNNAKVGVTTQISNLVEDTTPQLGGELDFNGNSVGGDAQTATGDGTTTIDWKLGNFFHFQFGAFNETFTFTAPTKAGTFILKLVQDSVGSRTVTFPATVKWSGGTAPTLTTTATTGTDIITFYFDGTNYFAVEVLDFS